MDTTFAQKRIKELTALIEEHNYNYYALSKPLITDLEFDALFNELLALEKVYPEFALPNSPTKKVGSDLISDLKKNEVKHIIPLLSLDKVYTLNEIKTWYSKYLTQSETPLFLSMEPKIDGFSVVLQYKKGEFYEALSRGNGIVGNNITENIKTIKSLPIKINSKNTYLIRGEVFINKEDFDAINNDSKTEYANPRNFSAGVIRRIKSSEVENVPLRFFVYEATCLEKEFDSHFDMFTFLHENKFPLAPFTTFFTPSSPINKDPESLFEVNSETKPECDLNFDLTHPHSLDCIETFVEEIKKVRSSLEFDIDGLVFKLNSKKLRLALGETSHHPRWAMAFKFESPKATSIVLNIITQVGRTGKITPLALLTPTLVNGSTVSKATLHNQEYINSLELGIGDVVEISKRGEIIPAVEKVLEKKGTTFILPPTCPSCHSLLEIKGAHLFCVNTDCPEKIKGGLLYFTQTLEMDGFGVSIIDLLYTDFNIKTPPELFTFDYKKLLSLQGFKDKKIDNYNKAIQFAITKKTFKELLIALGIPEIGERVVTVLMENGFNSLNKINELCDENSLERLNQFFGIGDITAKAVLENLKTDSPYSSTLRELEKIGFNLTQNTEKKESVFEPIFNDTNWVITGTFEHFKPREKAAEIIKELGGKTVSAVTNHTTHLLVGQDAGSKLAKAKKISTIQIVEEAKFLTLVPKEILKKGEE